MKNKPRKAVREAILHTGVNIPITDPAEQAALDRRCREAENRLAASSPDSRKAKPLITK